MSVESHSKKIIKNTDSGIRASKYNNYVTEREDESYIGAQKINRIEEYEKLYESGVEYMSSTLEDMFQKRYFSNEHLYSLRNSHNDIDYNADDIKSNFELNISIGRNNLYGEKLNNTNLNYKDNSFRIELKYQRILSFLIYNICHLSTTDNSKLFSNMLNNLYDKFHKDSKLELKESNYMSIIIEDLLKEKELIKDRADQEKFKEIIENINTDLYTRFKKDGIVTAGIYHSLPDDMKQNEHMSEIDEIIYIKKESKFDKILGTLENIFDYIIDSSSGVVDINKAKEYNISECDFLDFIALPYFDHLNKCNLKPSGQGKKNIKRNKTKRKKKDKKEKI